MQLATERLILREYTNDDLPALFAYQSDERYLRYYQWTERSEADAREFLQMLIGWQKEEPRRRFQLAITFPESGELIGSAGIRRKAESEFEADIGYELASQHWGRGYATEAARALLHFGFRDLKLHRISASLVGENTRSARVLERLGMTLEGRLRENEYFKGRWWDTLVYAILEDEWRIAGNQETA